LTSLSTSPHGARDRGRGPARAIEPLRHRAIAAADRERVWAVGWSRSLPYGNRTKQSLVLHWNGSAWSRVTSPNLGAQTVFEDVVALSPTDAWAVGYASGSGALARPWNGTDWTTAPTPPLGSLDAASALSASNLWASGTDGEGRLQFANWRGSSWTLTPAPEPGGAGTPQLTGMAAVAHGTVWAVGSVWDGTNGTGRPLVMRTTNG
jgi:hypothetical protein